MGRNRHRLFVCALVALGAAVACGDDAPPGSTFYERSIQPIFDASCVGNVAGCHAINDGDPFAVAGGNLDLSSFEQVSKRRDVLRGFGAYPQPLLLVKAVAETCELPIAYDDDIHCSEVPHAGGPIFDVGSPAYLTLQTWLANGATENGVAPPTPPEEGEGSCSTAVPAGFDTQVALDNPTFGQFRDEVMPVLRDCNSGNCHGAPAADFYITCGDDDDQLAFNFVQAWNFIDDPVADSELLLRPLALSAGGHAHTGGDFFRSRTDAGYEAVSAWAGDDAVGRLVFGEGDPGKEFFAEHVQPILLKRGCSFEACHSPQSTNDLKLRSGSPGFFSALALEKNYDLVRNDFMALELADARRSRAVAKNLLRSRGGLAHRGGALLAGGATDPAQCPQPFDPATASAFCVFQEWVRIEREGLLATGQVSPMGAGDTVPIVYVDRQASHLAGPLEFDTYQAGSDLLVAEATLDAAGGFSSVGAPRSLLTSCPGAGDRGVVDVSAPDVHPDGQRIAFAMRTSASAPRAIYVVNLDGTGCAEVAPQGFPTGSANGLLIHNFDPAWSPDGDHLVFASTRGNPDAGPTRVRTAARPQSDIWRMDADGGNPRQMTFLTNSEVAPAFKREGRIIMSTEKAFGDFYQVAGRRINWDGTDYHPLLAQRAFSALGNPDDPTALMPSVDYEQALDLVEGADGNFLYVLSDRGARSGGTVASFNRSIGPFEAGRDDPGYLPSMRIFDHDASGRAGATDGIYRSPRTLPDGRIMASYAGFGGDASTVTALDYDVVALAPCTPPPGAATCTPTRTTLIGGAGQQVEAVLAIRRPLHAPYNNRRQLVFGGFADEGVTGEGMAIIHMPDAPLLFTLLTANLRRGRPADLYRAATRIAIYVEGFAPPDFGGGSTYENRTLVGTIPLRSDGSTKMRVPAGVGVVIELQDDSGTTLVSMGEEHQMGPGEVISMGIVEPLFDSVCGGCHGSVSGREIDIHVTPDALTGASKSLSLTEDPYEL